MTIAAADMLTDPFLTLNRSNYRPIRALGSSVDEGSPVKSSVIKNRQVD